MSGRVPLLQGSWIHNDTPCPDTATIAVTGQGGSGTTMVARVLTALGLHMGHQLTPRSHEDKEIQVVIRAGDLAAFERICGERNRGYQKWGFKCPALRKRVGPAAALMRKPRFIWLVRDMLAVAVRREVIERGTIIDALRKSADDYRRMVQTIGEISDPVLLLSYEKALQYPAETVRTIAEFCGLPDDEQSVARACTAILNGDPRYTGASG